jgi:hypothetical protein
VNRVVIAGEFCEADDVFVLDRFRRGLTHSYGKIFKVVCLKRDSVHRRFPLRLEPFEN